MAEKQHSNTFAAEYARRFDELTQWAINSWPDQRLPLKESDLKVQRAALIQILVEKLADNTDPQRPSYGRGQDEPQYSDLNPSPWP